MTALAAHLPHLPNIIAALVILAVLLGGYLWHEYRRAPLVDEDQRPIEFDPHATPIHDAAVAAIQRRGAMVASDDGWVRGRGL